MNLYTYFFYWMYKFQKRRREEASSLFYSSMIITVLISFLFIDLQLFLLRFRIIEKHIEPFPTAIIFPIFILILNVLFFAVGKRYLLIEAKYDNFAPNRHRRAKFACAGIAVLIFLGLFII